MFWKQEISTGFHPQRPCREFHVSRAARQRYSIEDTLFSLHGNVVFADIGAAQRLAYAMNQLRQASLYPEQAVKAGDLYAAGILDELLHLMVDTYLERVNPAAMREALIFVQEKLTLEPFLETQYRFVQEFPSTEVYRGQLGIDDYLNRSSHGVSHREIALEESLMLWLANENPALARFRELFDDTVLETQTAYRGMIQGLSSFFASQPPLTPDAGTLIEVLRAPALASPDSLEGQLDYIRQHWAPFLGERLAKIMPQVLQTIDLLKEERKPGWGGPPGNFPAPVLTKEALSGEMFQRSGGRRAHEYEHFSQDDSWMPRVVMLAKSTYVWLDQLSRQYQQPIERLDQIPDAELDELARRGFNGLWLIGLWERSEASRKIKHLRGQPDAVASAYSLYDYMIAADLGGDAAYENLLNRARQRGIRLASDMVPNHVGIDGRWVIEHPEWFLQLDHPPFPSYSFNGPDLSSDPRVGIFLEDHYYDNSDAAVVFKRLDRWTGQARYIYHGNDGTSFPWNDTAQLNYLNAETREAVIQTIFHVARKFSIIRFDAAMTLAKQHIQRLWFPEPGTGGDIPSRAAYGSMSNDDFDRLIPREFWREVVDRVAKEVPGTLLLAEAFWMMEGYFVRTLGMHRVYNSAFMNMLKREDNQSYRQLIKNTLEFDPDILKRYVNFMNNPDEETAVHQFGKDDKYFGVCLMMSTMPGLPMYGHGQIEGYTEKYGMEYRRAKYNELPDQWLIDRHYREVFPLLHRRAEFAEVENFTLYDFYTPEGQVDENVFAYSNYHAGQGSLCLFHNKFAVTKGWIKRSSAIRDKAAGKLIFRNVYEGLRLQGGEKHFVIFRDHIAGLDYLRQSQDIQHRGLYFELEAFKYRILTDIREVYDADGSLQALYDQIGWQGVPNVFDAREDLRLMPLHQCLRRFMQLPLEATDEDVKQHYQSILELAKNYGLSIEPKQERQALSKVLTLFRRLGSKAELIFEPFSPKDALRAQNLMLIALMPLGEIWLKDWRLFRLVDAEVLSLSLKYKTLFTPRASAAAILSRLLQDEKVRQYLRVNTWQDKTYFNQEAFRYLLSSLLSAVWLESERDLQPLIKSFAEAETKSGYEVAKLVPAKVKAVRKPLKAKIKHTEKSSLSRAKQAAKHPVKTKKAKSET